ncbi:chloride channel protein [Niveibacterium sp. SC-1]|uniref:chloride channel protein n=1 Tax=Niveibacterium sp. SC-1 TaxID=3135646 RepID=UPI00311ED87C
MSSPSLPPHSHAGNPPLDVAPSLAPTLQAAHMPQRGGGLAPGVLRICGWAALLGLVAAGVAWLLLDLIARITQLAYFQHWSGVPVSPAGHGLGAWAVAIPVVGGVIVGLMARYGAKAIRGHGIPEAMEQILTNDSRIAPRMSFLKPFSAAIAIGTGGPFGAEGPIIATGGALGSVLGQWLRITPSERKTLLAAGAVAGMAAIFDAPIAAIALAIELLLFEFRARSLLPICVAVVVATLMRKLIWGSAPLFAMSGIVAPGAGALLLCVLIGALIGLASVGATRLVYAVEDAFAHLPIHWMWWPAIGGLAVGLIGLVAPRTLGVGYENIEAALGGQMALGALLALCLFKFLSWVLALGSGTSGGTLAPLFTVGSCLGAALGLLAGMLLPGLGLDPRLAALVGMAAMFAGASRALLTSVIFAFETTHQSGALLPLLAGCTAAYLVSARAMSTTIMTEKIFRRGVRVPTDYQADFLEGVRVDAVCTRDVVCLASGQTLKEARAYIEAEPLRLHQGYPVLDARGGLAGVLTRRDLLDPQRDLTTLLAELIRRPAVTIGGSHSLREAADHMVTEGVGRLVVVTEENPGRMIGILTRGDLLGAHVERLRQNREARRHALLPWRKGVSAG